METATSWTVCGGAVPLDRPVVIGILNVTPDSFSDGDQWLVPTAAVDRAIQMVDEGADIVDVGAESTRPGANPVDAGEEWRRLAPIVSMLVRQGVSFSVDTTKLEVARRALDEGAVAINDVSGLRFSPEIAPLCGEYGAGLILMHMRGDPRSMQADLEYVELLAEIAEFLLAQAAVAKSSGCKADQIVIDPGIGFGKSAEQNLELLGRIDELTHLGYPVLVGPSRKSFIGQTLGLPVNDRLEATIAACLAAFEGGAGLFRVHDVAPVRRALDMADAIRQVALEATCSRGGRVNDQQGDCC